MYDFTAARTRFNSFPENPLCQVGIDFEATGLNLRHGDMPFMCAATFSNGNSLLWQAEVDPFTRQPQWSASDLSELTTLFQHKDWEYVMSNKKYDTRCAALIIKSFDPDEFLRRCHETIAMHHVLHNLESHALKDAAAKHAGISDTDESDLTKAVAAARKLAAPLGWKIASKVNCPLVLRKPNKGWGVMDYWLPRQMALHLWRTSDAFRYLDTHSSSEPDLLKAIDHIRINKLDGWEWHPPEVHPQEAHPWHTVCAKYCRLDTLRTVRLFKIFKAALLEQHLWEIYLENQINSLMTFKIENNGVCLNTTLAKQELSYYRETAEDAKTTVGFSLSPLYPFNPDSGAQVRFALYDKRMFGLRATRFTKSKNKRGQSWEEADAKPKNPTIDKEFLADIIGKVTPVKSDDFTAPRWSRAVEPFEAYQSRMASWHTMITDGGTERGRLNQLYCFCASLIMHKKANINQKQIKSFLQNCLVSDDAIEGFATLYPSINPWGTKTNRQSSSNPNGHNISKGGGVRKQIEHLFKVKQTLRSLFGPSPGREWWSVDYHQLQLYIFAFISGDTKLIKALLEGQDAHDYMARVIFDLPTDPAHPQWELLAPTEEQRRIAKNVNFGFLFGAQEAKINQTAGVAGLYDKLANRLPGAINFLAKMEWQVRHHGYVRTMGGYKLYVPEETPYAGSVYAIQGTEAEIVKRATYGVQDYIDRRVKNKKELYITLPVHDELNFDAILGRGEQYIGSICTIMDDAAESYGVMAHVEPKLCRENWSKGKKYVFDEAI